MSASFPEPLLRLLWPEVVRCGSRGQARALSGARSPGAEHGRKSCSRLRASVFHIPASQPYQRIRLGGLAQLGSVWHTDCEIYLSGSFRVTLNLLTSSFRHEQCLIARAVFIGCFKYSGKVLRKGTYYPLHAL